MNEVIAILSLCVLFIHYINIFIKFLLGIAHAFLYACFSSEQDNSICVYRLQCVGV